MKGFYLVKLGLVVICYSVLIKGDCEETVSKNVAHNSIGRRTVKSELQCGEVFDRLVEPKKPKKSAERIFNGDNVLPGEAPYQVRLSKHPKGHGHFCSGVIINKYTILTTGRCASRGKRGELFAVVGDVYVKDEPDEDKIIEIDSIEIHPEYKFNKRLGRPVGHDIAMLKTKEKLVFNITKTGDGSVNQICLPPRHLKIKETERMIVSGWGYTSENEHKATILQRASVYLLKLKICANMYQNISSTDTICAKGMVETPCFGDWGAPLVRDVNGKFELLGLFSFNEHSSDSACVDSPGVYTRVSSFLRWIDFNE